MAAKRSGAQKAKKDKRREGEASAEQSGQSGGGRQNGMGRGDERGGRGNRRAGRTERGRVRQSARSRSFADALTQSARAHPAATIAIGAGVGLLLAQGARLAWTSAAMEALREEVEERGGYGSLLRERAEYLRDEAATLARYGRRGAARVGEALEEGASAVGRVAAEGYERGREFAAESWQNHPLAMGAAALVLGATAGMLLPSLPAEVAALGETSARAASQLREGAERLWTEGKELVTKTVAEAANATAREADRVGLTPDKLGRKVKRLAGTVRNAVANAV